MEGLTPPSEPVTPESPPAPPAGSEGAAPGALARLIWVIGHPADAFRGLDADRLAWIAPVILVAILLWLPSQHATIRNLHVERQRAQIEKIIDRGVLPAEQGEEMLTRLDEQREIGLGQRLLQLGLGMVSLLLLRIMLPALVLFAGVRFVLSAQARYPSLMSVLALGALPAGLREIIRLPLQLAKGSLDVYFSPAVLTGTESVAGYALNQIDLFDLWILWLLCIGVGSVGGFSRGRAAGLVIPLWVVYTLLKIGYKATPFGVGV